MVLPAFPEEIGGARLGLVGRGGGVAEARPDHARSIVPHARRERDDRAARPRLVRDHAPYHGGDERGELVAGARAEGGQELLERAAARARSEQRERRVDRQRREDEVRAAAGGREVLREAEREWRQGGAIGTALGDGCGSSLGNHVSSAE